MAKIFISKLSEHVIIFTKMWWPDHYKLNQIFANYRITRKCLIWGVSTSVTYCHSRWWNRKSFLGIINCLSLVFFYQRYGFTKSPLRGKQRIIHRKSSNNLTHEETMKISGATEKQNRLQINYFANSVLINFVRIKLTLFVEITMLGV